MTVTRVTRLAYAILGALDIVIGAGSILLPTGWLPQRLTDRMLAGETLGPFGQHLLQEFGTVVLALGLVLLWCARREEFSRGLHWALTFALALDASIHWVGPHGIIGSLPRGIVNSIPFAVLLILGLLQERLAMRSPDPMPPERRAGIARDS